MALLKRSTRIKARCSRCGGPLPHDTVKTCAACVQAHFWRCDQCLELVPNTERASHDCPAGEATDIMDWPDHLPF
jgi:predicted RNA-binding Zn-ribbon protein involved in translation (DUF1610 family)